MSLSLDKSTCLYYGYNNNRHQFHINGLAIKAVDQCADLGVLRSGDFNQKHHINTICLKASKLATMIRCAFCTKDKTFLMKLFTVFVTPLPPPYRVCFKSLKSSLCPIWEVHTIHFWPSKTVVRLYTVHA